MQATFENTKQRHRCYRASGVSLLCQVFRAGRIQKQKQKQRNMKNL